MNKIISRIIGIISIVTTSILIIILSVKVIPEIKNNIVLFILSIVVGAIIVDFLSGLVHWAGDTWGKENWPILGPMFIHPFRLHHKDKKEICEHDFIRTNKNNGIITTPFLIISIIYFSKNNFFIASTCLIIGILGFLTNQIHKWAHNDKVNILIRILQKLRIILSPKEHKIHHKNPHKEYYSITNGLTNKFLKKIKFYRILEKIITKITGAIPRNY